MSMRTSVTRVSLALLVLLALAAALPPPPHQLSLGSSRAAADDSSSTAAAAAARSCDAALCHRLCTLLGWARGVCHDDGSCWCYAY